MSYKRLLAVATLISLVPATLLAEKMSVPLFSLDGKEYLLEDIDSKLQHTYRKAEAKAQKKKAKVVKQAMLHAYFATIAEKNKTTIDEVSLSLVPATAADDKQIQKFYDDNKEKIGAPLKEVIPLIKARLEVTSRQMKAELLIEELINNGRFVSFLPAPVAPVLKMDLTPFPSKGKESAPIKLVELADYRCPHCVTAKKVVDDIIKEFPDQVQFFYVDYPVLDRGMPGISTYVSHGAYCAGNQGKYWPFHDKSYRMGSRLSKSSPLTIAKELGLDQDKFTACMATKDESSFGTYVQKAIDLAQMLGVSSTPSFFINGQAQEFQNLEKDLKKEIERRLKNMKK
ncbi:MAG: thioredoxin domain-containing protein [Candidatus Endonucleobacter bathymodioli]|uniref:Thioredoxin domain-containing protein n=1 Tax=Candidatus Endonucleibacter bathymodioli TaxID=539814 RepID=A0AA90SWY0_9GAMM|nr:thioredoxin domain-containing protein [Candidatus Endonucleobacter bathymodioli]